MESGNQPRSQFEIGLSAIDRQAITEQILRICELLPSESLLEVLNFAIHELGQVFQNQAGKDQ